MAVSKKTGYLPSLDGWRALSILAVMVDHSYDFMLGRHNLGRWQGLGGLGVDVFFAISGILICTRLLEEEALLGRINLRGFYIRRLLRIQPAALVYLLAVAALSVCGWFPQGWTYWFGSIFVYRNFQTNVLSATVSTQGFLTGHFWTLAIEEHFYLLLSLVLYFIRSRRTLLLALAFGASLIWPMVAMHYFPAASMDSAQRTTGFQLQYLFPAALYAVLLRDPRVYAWSVRWLQPFQVLALTAVAAVGFHSFQKHFGTAFLDAHLHHLRFFAPQWTDFFLRMFPVWIVATMLHPEALVTRLLELSALRWIGRISYSLYLWHVLFFRGPWPLSVPQPQSPLLHLTHQPWNLIASFVCASLSFYVVERPLMRLGHKLAPPATAGREDMQQEPSIEAAIDSRHSTAS